MVQAELFPTLHGWSWQPCSSLPRRAAQTSLSGWNGCFHPQRCLCRGPGPACGQSTAPAPMGCLSRARTGHALWAAAPQGFLRKAGGPGRFPCRHAAVGRGLCGLCLVLLGESSVGRSDAPAERRWPLGGSALGQLLPSVTAVLLCDLRPHGEAGGEGGPPRISPQEAPASPPVLYTAVVSAARQVERAGEGRGASVCASQRTTLIPGFRALACSVRLTDSKGDGCCWGRPLSSQSRKTAEVVGQGLEKGPFPQGMGPDPCQASFKPLVPLGIVVPCTKPREPNCPAKSCAEPTQNKAS